MEKTYVMLKPDAVERGLIGNIISRFENKGYKVENMKMFILSKEKCDEHYAHKTNEPYYPEILNFMTRGPVIGMIISGNGAVDGVRKICGPTYYTDAAPGTIRGDFANTLGENLVHASDTIENAKLEIERFFK